jgi:integrase
LLVQANANGQCSWRYLRKKHDGQIFKSTFGSTATFNLFEARDWARAFNAIIERGGDPTTLRTQQLAAEAERKSRQTMTVEAAWNLYIGALENEGNHVPHTLSMKRCRFRRDIGPAIGQKPLCDVEHDDLWRIVEAKKEAGFTSASNHLVPDIKVFFKWCITYGRTATGLRRNPAVDLIKLSRDRSRRRTFNLMELRLFIRALAATQDELARRLFSLLLLSGQRLGNVLRARPAEWCTELDAWEIERTKNDEPNVVPLSSWGKSLFAGGDGTWLFPSVRGDGPRLGHITPLYRDIRALMRAIAPEGHEVQYWTPHDLRRVIRTHMSRLRVRREVAERVIAHKPEGVEAIYDRYEYLDEKRTALKLWESELRRIAIEENVAIPLGIPLQPVPMRPATRFDWGSIPNSMTRTSIRVGVRLSPSTQLQVNTTRQRFDE